MQIWSLCPFSVVAEVVVHEIVHYHHLQLEDFVMYPDHQYCFVFDYLLIIRSQV